MSMPVAVKSFHTAWLTSPGGQPHPVRYAVDGQRLLLAHVPLGRTIEEVQASLDEQRARRRVVELVA